MDRATIEPAIQIVLTEIHSKLTKPRGWPRLRSLHAIGQHRRRRVGCNEYRTTDLWSGRPQDTVSLLNRRSCE
jgi:hypothetical protein